jgi:tetratricopeptide (TPR) repeat protein
LKQYANAIKYINKAIESNAKLGNKGLLSNMYYSLGNVFNETGEHKKAIKYCLEALEMATELGALPQRRISSYCLYRAHKSLGEKALALQYHELYKEFSDSLQKMEVDKQLVQLEMERTLLSDSLSREEEKLKLEINHQNALRKKDKTNTLLLGVVVLALIIIIVVMGKMLYFKKSSMNFQNKATQLEKQRLINEISLLRTQVNPHFLFNSLSILSSLVKTDADLSERFIEQLSKSYRYILEQNEQDQVSLRTELEFVEAYTFLLKIRFENKFDVRINITEAEKDAHGIAPLTLQLLIENAVKHNKMSAKDPLYIDMHIVNNTLIVINKLRPRSGHNRSTGIGLKNIKERYALLSDKPMQATTFEDQFVVQVPLLPMKAILVQEPKANLT